MVVAGLLESRYADIPKAWTLTLLGSSVIFLAITVWHYFMLPQEKVSGPAIPGGAGQSRSILSAFATFFRKPGILLAIVFLLLYRLPEAFSVKMLTPFLLDPVSEGGLGLTTAQSGLVYGTVGVIALTIGGILGGIWSAKVGLRRALWPFPSPCLARCISILPQCSRRIFLRLISASPSTNSDTVSDSPHICFI